MKRITIIAPGSRGDVEPYLALGIGLTKAGHLVRLVTHENFKALVESRGVEFWPIIGDVRDVAESMAVLLEQGNFLSILSQMAKEAQQGAVQLMEGAWGACQGIDLVLAGVGGLFVGTAIAEKLQIPLVQAYYIPFTPTGDYPSFLIPKLPIRLGNRLNRFTYHLARQMMWQAFRPADRIARRDVLSLPTTSFWGPYKSESLRHQPILYGFSPSVITPASDWGPRTYATGYWFPELIDEWTPPPALEEFLKAGSPPVYIGFGSMSNQKPEEMMNLVLEALKRSGQRGIVLAGWGGMETSNLPDTVFMLDSAPFTWLFPRMAAVVHHGGAGTTAVGLRAGVPSILVPFFADQPFWGQRVAELGVGPDPIPRKKLTVERLAKAIQTVVTDLEMRHRATEVGAKIQSEDGVTRAVEIIQNC